MTDTEKKALRDQAIIEVHDAKENLAFWTARTLNYAGKLERIAEGLHNNPSYVNGTPPIQVAGGRLDYREALLDFPTRDQIIEASSQIREWKNKVAEAERKLTLAKGQPLDPATHF